MAAVGDARVVLDAEANLHAEVLQELPFDGDDGVSVVCALSGYGLKQAQFLNALFGTSLSAERRGVDAAFVKADDSAALIEMGRSLVVLDVEPFDGPSARLRAEQRDKAAHLALTLADAVLFSIRMVDLMRLEASGLTTLRSSLAEVLRLESADSSVTSRGRLKRLFVLIIRGYEADVIERDELIAGLMRSLQVIYDSAAKPPRAPVQILEVFDFEFVTLPDENAFPDEYAAQFTMLQRRLLDPACDDYLFESGDYARPQSLPAISNVATAAWAMLDDEEQGDLPEQKELTAAFDCDSVMRRTHEEYLRSVRVWRRDTEGGAVIEKFGEQAAKLKNDIMKVYEQDAVNHKGSRAWRRKRDELKALIDDDLYVLYAAQVAKLRDSTYRAFRDALTEVADGDNDIDRKVNAALKEANRGFKAGADSLRPRNSAWRCDGDVKQLAAQMKEDANERIQLARIAELQDNVGSRRRRRMPRRTGKGRQPISLGIHYLNPAPFGMKDSRYEKLNIDDTMGYQPPPRNSNAVVALPPANGNGGNGGPSEISIPLTPQAGEPWSKYG